MYQNKEFWKTKTEKSALEQNKLDISLKVDIPIIKEFDPGSGRTLAARLTHASRTDLSGSLLSDKLVADG